jgi:hypothetical protein
MLELTGGNVIGSAGRSAEVSGRSVLLLLGMAYDNYIRLWRLLPFLYC